MVVSFSTYLDLAVCTYVFLLALSYVYVRAGMSAAQLHVMPAVWRPLVYAPPTPTCARQLHMTACALTANTDLTNTSQNSPA